MTLDRFDQTDPSAESVALDKDAHHNVAELFARSALFELHQSAFGLAQTFGMQDRVGTMEQPTEADSGVAPILPSHRARHRRLSADFSRGDDDPLWFWQSVGSPR